MTEFRKVPVRNSSPLRVITSGHAKNDVELQNMLHILTFFICVYPLNTLWYYEHLHRQSLNKLQHGESNEQSLFNVACYERGLVYQQIVTGLKLGLRIR